MNNISHLFEVEGRKYILDYKRQIFCRLNGEEYEHFKTVFKNIESSQQIPDNFGIFSELFKCGYFITKEKEETIPSINYETLNISFAPIHDCNFLCRYCYAEGGTGTSNYRLQFDEAKINLLLEHIYKEKYYYYNKYKFDFVSGGEPLLNVPLLEYFLSSMRKISKKEKKETTVLIVTNGSLITPEIIKILDKYDVFLGISIDGPEEIHNRHRVYKNGTGTYKDVTKGIATLRCSDASSKIKDAWAMAVVARDTGSLVDVMETCVDLGFSRMQMQLLRAAPDAPLSIRLADTPMLKKKYIELIEHILSFIEKGDLSRVKMIANDNDSFGKYIRRLLLRYPVYYRCFAGKNKISITAQGQVYPCDSFCGESDFCLGSIYHKSENKEVLKRFKEAHCQNRPNCSTCWGRYICGGDCYYNSYIVNADILKPDPVVCEMNLFFIEQTIDMLTRIQKINPEYIQYLARLLRKY